MLDTVARSGTFVPAMVVAGPLFDLVGLRGCYNRCGPCRLARLKGCTILARLDRVVLLLHRR